MLGEQPQARLLLRVCTISAMRPHGFPVGQLSMRQLRVNQDF